MISWWSHRLEYLWLSQHLEYVVSRLYGLYGSHFYDHHTSWALEGEQYGLVSYLTSRLIAFSGLTIGKPFNATDYSPLSEGDSRYPRDTLLVFCDWPHVRPAPLQKWVEAIWWSDRCRRFVSCQVILLLSIHGCEFQSDWWLQSTEYIWNSFYLNATWRRKLCAQFC